MWHYGIIEHKDFLGTYYSLHEFCNVNGEEVYTKEAFCTGNTPQEIIDDVNCMISDIDKYGVHKKINHDQSESDKGLIAELEKRNKSYLESPQETISLDEIETYFFEYKDKYKKLQDSLRSIKSMLEESTFENISAIKRVIEKIDIVLGE